LFHDITTRLRVADDRRGISSTVLVKIMGHECASRVFFGRRVTFSVSRRWAALHSAMTHSL